MPPVPAPLLKWFLRIQDQYTTSVFFDYKTNAYFGSDVPVEGLAWTMLDGSNMVLGSGITGADGMASVVILEAFDDTGLGIHVIYTYQNGVNISIDNIPLSVTIGEELNLFDLNPTMLWAHDLTAIEGTVRLFDSDGNLLLTEITDNLGIFMKSDCLIPGTYIIEMLGLYNTTFDLLIDYSSPTYTENILVSAGSFESENNKLVEFYIRNYKKGVI